MKQSRFIEQILVIGEGQKMPAVLYNQILVCKRNGQDDIKWFVAVHLKKWPKTRLFMREFWKKSSRVINSLANGKPSRSLRLHQKYGLLIMTYLTPTFKPKKRSHLEKYKHLYDKIYA